MTIQELMNQNGGTWGEHPEYPVADWQQEVSSDHTHRGYWEWVLSCIERDG